MRNRTNSYCTISSLKTESFHDAKIAETGGTRGRVPPATIMLARKEIWGTKEIKHRVSYERQLNSYYMYKVIIASATYLNGIFIYDGYS